MCVLVSVLFVSVCIYICLQLYNMHYGPRFNWIIFNNVYKYNIDIYKYNMFLIPKYRVHLYKQTSYHLVRFWRTKEG